MKILQVSGFDTIGIQVNGYLLHEYYRKHGHDSSMYVHERHSRDEDVHTLFHPLVSRLNGVAVKLQTWLSLWSMLPVEACTLPLKRGFHRADIVHLHLLHNAQFFSLFLLPILTWLKPKGRVLLSIHDMFMFTGHCVYSVGCDRWKIGCGRCPDFEIPFPIQRDTTRLSWRIKRLIFRASRIHLMVGSPWQDRHVAQSPILRHLPRHYVPYGIDTRVYRQKDKSACRARFSIPDDADVISFRSTPFSRNFKGTEYIVKALELYQPKRETFLLTFEGVGGLDTLKGKYRMIHLEWTNSDQELIAGALNAADIFLMPSIAEGFGLMAIEALACATPVIVFEGTALPETIDAPNCGMAVPPRDHVALADAVRQLLDDRDLRDRLARRGLAHVEAHHTFEQYADAYLDIYERIVAGA